MSRGSIIWFFHKKAPGEMGGGGVKGEVTKGYGWG